MVFLLKSDHLVKGVTYFLSLFNIRKNIISPGVGPSDPLAYNNVDKIDKFSTYSHVVGNFYQNPVISSNLPDPSVIKLKNGQGYALVATSENAIASDNQGNFPYNNSTAFPIYFSRGWSNSRVISIYTNKVSCVCVCLFATYSYQQLSLCYDDLHLLHTLQMLPFFSRLWC